MNMSRTRLFAAVSAVFFLASIAPFLRAQGHWEFGAHYSKWGINLFKSVIEGAINDALESNLRDNFLEKIQSDYPSLRNTGYKQTVSFDSSGNNYGFEIRYYPGGNNGSFSIGLSVEKTTMKVALTEVSSSMTLEDDITRKKAGFEGTAGGEFMLKPLSFHFSLRWDIFPSAGLHPYITFGGGASTAEGFNNASTSYEYNGTLAVPGNPPETYSGSENKTIKQLKDEQEAKGEDFSIPINFIPFVQLNLGLKGRLTDNLHVLVDAGIWDGFLLRAGVAFRF
jgi:hypothetical protein